MMPVKGLIFDLDGTLIDSAADLCSSVNFGRRKFDLPELSLKTVASFVGDGITNLIIRSFKDTGVTVEEALPIVAAHYKVHSMDTTRPYPGVAETLPLLKQKMCIVTNKPEGFVPAMLKSFGIYHYFEFVIGGDSLPNRKPHPSVGYYAAEKLGLKTTEIAVVGDHCADLELAINCSMQSIFCNYGIGLKKGFAPTVEISEFSALTSVLPALK
ncbi:MAG: HAD-IA family hydrolase [Fibrobacteres bacterium]|nr:HAD-IA family hydrolase [Fibrobacterota bacterium]